VRKIPPQVHAMLVCDQTFQQAVTGKWCVIGTHDTVMTAQVPFVHTFAVFVSLGDFESGSRFQIVIRHEGGDVVCQVDAEAGTPEQLSSFDVGVQLPQLALQKDGDWFVDLRVAGKVIASRTLHVQVRAP
jgi:hypothetical protein